MLFLLGQDCVILPTVILRFTNFKCRNKLRKKRVCVDVNRCILDSKI